MKNKVKKLKKKKLKQSTNRSTINYINEMIAFQSSIYFSIFITFSLFLPFPTKKTSQFRASPHSPNHRLNFIYKIFNLFLFRIIEVVFLFKYLNMIDIFSLKFRGTGKC